MPENFGEKSPAVGEGEFEAKTAVVREWIENEEVEVPELSTEQVLANLTGDLQREYENSGKFKPLSDDFGKEKSYLELGQDSDAMARIKESKKRIEGGDLDFASSELTKRIEKTLAILDREGQHLAEGEKKKIQHRAAAMLVGRDVLQKELNQ